MVTKAEKDRLKADGVAVVARIKSLKKQGWSYTEIAAAAGIYLPRISEILHGKRPMTTNNLEKFMRVPALRLVTGNKKKQAA